MIATFDAIATGTDIQRRIGVKTSRDEPLARFTTMRVGGPADLFATAHNAHELRALVRFARTRELPHVILGRGSDVVIADAGIRGLVIQVRAEGSRTDGDRYTAEAGVQMARAATETQRAGLTGLEFGLAIPGTVGGAVWANAGAHEADVAGVLESARVLAGRRHGVDRRRRRPRVRLSREPVQGGGDPWRGRRDRRDLPPGPGRPRAHQGAARRHPPLAAGPPAARPAVGGERLPEPAGRLGRPAHRRGRAEGHPDRRRGRVREARELHRQRPEGDRDRRPPPGRPGPRDGPRPSRRDPRLRDRVRRRLAGRAGGDRRERAPADRRPARRAVGRARRVGRVRDGDRRGAGRRRLRRRAGPHRPRRRAGGGCPPDIVATAGRGRLRRPGGARRDPVRSPVGAAIDRLAAARPAPVVFIALHGPFGEDGTVQALLEAADIAYTGSGVAASAIGMDKTLFKRMCRGIGLPVVDWREVRADRWAADPAAVRAELAAFAAAAPDPRLMVKPARLGSSVGMTLVHDPSELDARARRGLPARHARPRRDLPGGRARPRGRGHRQRRRRSSCTARARSCRATSSTTTRRSTRPGCPRRRPAPR